MTEDRLAPGLEFDGFRIERLIASDQTGAVYEATQLSFPRRVALKVIGRHADADAGRGRERAALEHRNILPVYERGLTPDGHAYAAMPLSECETLEQRIERDGPLDPRHALPVLEQIASALDAAYRADLTHGHLTPACVLLETTADGVDHAFVTDFGLVRGDPGADLRAFGATAYHALTGRPPDRGEPAPLPSEARPELDPAYDELVRRAMPATGPPPSALELVEEAKQLRDRSEQIKALRDKKRLAIKRAAPRLVIVALLIAGLNTLAGWSVWSAPMLVAWIPVLFFAVWVAAVWFLLEAQIQSLTAPLSTRRALLVAAAGSYVRSWLPLTWLTLAVVVIVILAR